MAAQSLQAMDLTSLRAVLAELRPQLVPSRFEKAQQADGQTLHLGFRTLERPKHRACWRSRLPPNRAMAAPWRNSSSTD